MGALLHTRGLAAGYNGRILLDHLDIAIERGQLCAMIGVNGIGKSTLLRTLAGIHAPLKGEVRIEDVPLSALSHRERARRISVVLTGRPQAGLLDVATLVSLGRQPWTGHLGRLSAEDHHHVQEALSLAGALDLRDRSIHELSDGECQKVLIARALAQRTPLMLLDEPTAFLDLANRVHVVRLLRQITRDGSRAVLFSTHDLQLALDLSDRILLIRHDRTFWQGSPREAIDQDVLATEFDDAHVRFDAAAGVFRAR